MSNDHALLAPSSALRWVPCPGSVLLEAAYPQTEDRPADIEGTAAHWAASEALRGSGCCVGEITPGAIVLTDEMIEGADLYQEAVYSVLSPGDDATALHIEEHVKIPYVNDLNDGTPDCWYFTHDPTRGIATLYIWDYKFGHGLVEVFENWQLLDYVCGILDLLGIDGHGDQRVRVVMTIVQPRSFHRDGPVRTWSAMACDLRPYFNKLQMAAAAALLPDALCKVNPECAYCLGRHACEALQRAVVTAVDISTSSIPLEMPPSALGLELRTLLRAQKFLEARITGLSEVVSTTLRRGSLVPFFALEPAFGRQKWAVDDADVIEMGAALSLDLAKPAEAITPKQAIKKGLDKGTADALSSTPSTGLKLVQDNGSQARKVFGK